MARVDNRVIELSDGNGLGELQLSGPYKSNNSFDIFGSDTFFYVIDLAEGTEWECGIGTIRHAGGDRFLQRTEVLFSSASGQLVNFTPGRKNVFSDLPANYQNKTIVSASRRFSFFTGA